MAHAVRVHGAQRQLAACVKHMGVGQPAGVHLGETEGRVRHAQRIEDVLLAVVCEEPARRFVDHVGKDIVSGVTVGEGLAGIEEQLDVGSNSEYEREW
jgi:hypothetical protein